VADAQPGARVVDWSGPLEQLAGNVDGLRDVVGAYVEEIRENLQVLPQSIAAGAAADARRQAHTVKGAMRMFGVREGIRCGQALEDAAASQQDGLLSLYAELKAAAEQALPELEVFAETGTIPAG